MANNLEKIQKIKRVLDEIKSFGILEGIMLSEREGTVICDNLEKSFNKAVCSSMCASVLESAIGLARISGDQKLQKIIAEVGDASLMIIECDEKRFITLFINPKSKVYKILSKIDDYIKQILLLYEYH